MSLLKIWIEEYPKNNFFKKQTILRIRKEKGERWHVWQRNQNSLPRTSSIMTKKDITEELMNILHMNSNFRKNRMSNERIQQIITLLYMHKKMVRSEGVALYESEELKKLIRRIDRNSTYYKTNKLIQGTFKFLGLVVDSWFQTV